MGMGPFLIVTYKTVLLTLVFGQDPIQTSLPESWALPTSWVPPIAGLLPESKTEALLSRSTKPLETQLQTFLVAVGFTGRVPSKHVCSVATT